MTAIIYTVLDHLERNSGVAQGDIIDIIKTAFTMKDVVDGLVAKSTWGPLVREDLKQRLQQGHLRQAINEVRVAQGFEQIN